MSRVRLSSFGGNLHPKVVFVVVVFVVSFVLCVVSIERNLWFEFDHDWKVSCDGVVGVVGGVVEA